MKERVKCPWCGRESNSEPFNTWKFRFYKVNRFECSNCKEKFNVYDSPKSRFTIPKAKRK